METDAIRTPDETLPVEWVERDSLTPNEWNPNRMTDEKREELVWSIRDNGWTQPLVVDPKDDTIIDGEQRWHASRDSRIRSNEEITPDGIPSGHVPVFYLDADETQAMVATMQHNVNGSTNPDTLGEIFADLDDSGLFYETVERFQIGETGIDRLIERVDDDGSTAFDVDDDDDDPGPEAFTEGLELQFGGEEYAEVEETLATRDCSVLDLCEWAISENVHSQIRVDMRRLADRDSEYEPDEDVVEYPSVEIEEYLGSFLRDDDPQLEEA